MSSDLSVDALDRLVDSLLYEGYALYPYTPGAAKNATPTPFGIVYPPAYAAQSPHTHAMLRVQCILCADPSASLRGTFRFLQAAGNGHCGSERRIELGSSPLAELTAEAVGEEFEFDSNGGGPLLRGRVKLRADRLADGVARISICVHNTSELDPADADADRPTALRSSLLSTHAVLRTSTGRFVSPLQDSGPHAEAVAGCENVNTWPFLAGAGDDAVVGAAIFLPDHPRLAPESLGSLFDNTEIEEALLLHVKTLSDSEREQIEGQDPAVREMIERAETASPEQILALHGRLEEVRPEMIPGGTGAVPGEHQVTVDGVTLGIGSTVLLRPEPGRDPIDSLLDGRAATVERIFVDFEDGVHIGVTIDGDPGQELMRDTGRFMYFKPEEVVLQ
jgi:hypothetical protein